MQVVSNNFHVKTAADIRPITSRLMISFNKVYDATIGFFTLNESQLNGGDFLKGTGSVVQEWDKYLYEDFSSRIISIEWQREETKPSSYTMAIADIVLDNHDDLFTPGTSSLYSTKILPRRPVKIFSGFSNENIPVFVGLTEAMPEIDDKNKTAKFHCIDFMAQLHGVKLTQAVIYQNQRIDQILNSLLQLVGLSPLQYTLDTAYNTVPFAFFDKDTKFGDAVEKLMVAEIGNLYMDENGRIRFRNRQNYSDTAVMHFNRGNTLNLKTRKQADIINVVEVKSKVREVQNSQPIYELSSPIFVAGSGTATQFFDYVDPVTSVSTPTYKAYANDDGSGADLTANISISSKTDFSKASKIVFSNSSATPAYITNLQIVGTPAKIVKEIFVREEDTASMDKYEEQLFSIDNEFIQSENEARTIALVLLAQYDAFGAAYEIEVKGSPALQLNDQVSTSLGTVQSAYAIEKIFGSVSGGKFTQRLTLRIRNVLTYLTLNTSVLDGGDLLSP